MKNTKKLFLLQNDFLNVKGIIDPKVQRNISRFTYDWIFREVCAEYIQEMQKLANKLAELISLSLSLPAKRLNEFFEDQIVFGRINHYPPCPVPHLALGVGRHKDAGLFTILCQDDTGGLEIKRKTDGEWIGVKPTPDAYIVNLGDATQVRLIKENNVLLIYIYIYYINDRSPGV